MASTALSGRDEDCRLTCLVLATYVAPPSSVERGSYQFIQGGLDDLDGLPVLRNLDLPKAEGAKDGERGDKLFRHLMRAAPHVDDFDSLLDVARTFNDNCEPPMEEYRMISTAKSAWGYEQRGENWFGRRKAYLPLDGVEDWTDDVDSFFLLAYLRKHQGRTARFWIANGLADRFGWPIRRLVNARRRLIQTGEVRPLTKPSQGKPVVYVWRGHGKQ
jgi:Primase C terminal 1 (PriCT-1)